MPIPQAAHYMNFPLHELPITRVLLYWHDWTRTGDILLCVEPLLAAGLRHSIAKCLIRATSHVTRHTVTQMQSVVTIVRDGTRDETRLKVRAEWGGVFTVYTHLVTCHTVTTRPFSHCSATNNRPSQHNAMEDFCPLLYCLFISCL